MPPAACPAAPEQGHAASLSCRARRQQQPAPRVQHEAQPRSPQTLLPPVLPPRPPLQRREGAGPVARRVRRRVAVRQQGDGGWCAGAPPASAPRRTLAPASPGEQPRQQRHSHTPARQMLAGTPGGLHLQPATRLQGARQPVATGRQACRLPGASVGQCVRVSLHQHTLRTLAALTLRLDILSLDMNCVRVTGQAATMSSAASRSQRSSSCVWGLLPLFLRRYALRSLGRRVRSKAHTGTRAGTHLPDVGDHVDVDGPVPDLPARAPAQGGGNESAGAQTRTNRHVRGSRGGLGRPRAWGCGVLGTCVVELLLLLVFLNLVALAASPSASAVPCRVHIRSRAAVALRERVRRSAATRAMRARPKLRVRRAARITSTRARLTAFLSVRGCLWGRRRPPCAGRGVWVERPAALNRRHLFHERLHVRSSLARPSPGKSSFTVEIEVVLNALGFTNTSTVELQERCA